MLYFRFILLVSLGIVVCSCGEPDDVQTEESKTIQQLTSLLSSKDEFIQALNTELANINNALSEISEKNGIGFDSISDPLFRIQRFDYLLNESKDKIAQLEKQEVKVASTSEKELLNSVIRNLKETILEKENYISRLRYENDTLRSSNSALSINLMETKNNLDLADAYNIEQQKERRNLEANLEQERKHFSLEKEKMRKELENAKESINIEKSNAYFEIAMALKEEFDNTKSSKLRKGLINKSYENFRKACQLGHKASSSYIKLFLTEEKYYKELTITRSQTAISNCGI